MIASRAVPTFEPTAARSAENEGEKTQIFGWFKKAVRRVRTLFSSENRGRKERAKSSTTGVPNAIATTYLDGRVVARSSRRQGPAEQE